MSATISHITEEMGWRRGEARVFSFPITDDDDQAVVMTGATLRWRLLRQLGSGTILIAKASGGDGITVVNDSVDNIVQVTIDDDDYEDVPPGVYSHELRDMGNDLVLAAGDAWLLPGEPD